MLNTLTVASCPFAVCLREESVSVFSISCVFPTSYSRKWKTSIRSSLINILFSSLNKCKCSTLYFSLYIMCSIPTQPNEEFQEIYTRVHIHAHTHTHTPPLTSSCIFLTLVQVWKEKQSSEVVEVIFAVLPCNFPKLKKVEVKEKSKKREKVRGRERRTLPCLFCKAQF